MTFLNAAGVAVEWDALDEAEQSYFTAPLAEEIVEHVCRWWCEVATLEFLFEHPEHSRDFNDLHRLTIFSTYGG